MTIILVSILQLSKLNLCLVTCSYKWLTSSVSSLGGRGSYSDMGGPVITTQVTIPKDVGICTHTHTQWPCTRCTAQALKWGTCIYCRFMHVPVSSWPDQSSEREARGLSRSVVSLERRSKSTTHSRALRIASSPLLARRTRFRMHSTCYRTGKTSPLFRFLFLFFFSIIWLLSKWVQFSTEWSE